MNTTTIRFLAMMVLVSMATVGCGGDPGMAGGGTPARWSANDRPAADRHHDGARR